MNAARTVSVWMSECRFNLPSLRNTRPQPGCRHACSTVSDAEALVGDALLSLLLLLLLSLLLEDDMDDGLGVCWVCAESSPRMPFSRAPSSARAPAARPAGRPRQKWRRVYFFHLFSFHQLDANEKMSVRHFSEAHKSDHIV